MPSLRETLQSVSEHPNDYLHYYRMFEALVNELETQRWWEGRCNNEQLRRGEAERLLAIKCKELIEAKAEITGQADRLDKLYAEAGNLQIQLNRECRDARVEIAVLQEQRDLERAAVMMGKPVGPEAMAQFEELKADAEIGRLVREMRHNSRLRKGRVFYWADLQDETSVWHQAESRPLSSNPAEALRAIQETANE